MGRTSFNLSISQENIEHFKTMLNNAMIAENISGEQLSEQINGMYTPQSINNLKSYKKDFMPEQKQSTAISMIDDSLHASGTINSAYAQLFSQCNTFFFRYSVTMTSLNHQLLRNEMLVLTLFPTWKYYSEKSIFNIGRAYGYSVKKSKVAATLKSLETKGILESCDVNGENCYRIIF
ncbi:MAG: hypothetical protein ACI4WS_06435 [Oscillospiraceae bacterium]